MSDKTGIEWTDATWNPIRGCTRVSEGCRNCYAETVAARFSDPGQPYAGLAKRGPARWTGKVDLVEAHLLDPLRWRRPRRIFVNSMSDLFHEKVPDAWIDRIFAVMALAPQHTFQVLTKRADRMRQFVSRAVGLVQSAKFDGTAIADEFPHITTSIAHPQGLKDWPLPNVWLGVSVENQAAADERIPLLLATPAAKRFISAEPLLGPVELRAVGCDSSRAIRCWEALAGRVIDATGEHAHCPGLDWVIAGGESGANARPMQIEWAESLRDQCRAAGVAFFMKQMAKKAPIPQSLFVREFPNAR